jgi:hypothetical protein
MIPTLTVGSKGTMVAREELSQYETSIRRVGEKAKKPNPMPPTGLLVSGYSRSTI